MTTVRFVSFDDQQDDCELDEMDASDRFDRLAFSTQLTSFGLEDATEMHVQDTLGIWVVFVRRPEPGSVEFAADGVDLVFVVRVYDDDVDAKNLVIVPKV